MLERANSTSKRRLPPWLKRPVGSGQDFQHVLRVLESHCLETVCHSAACPNQGECYSHGTATFMIMGDRCTRNCRFCAVNHDKPDPLNPDEPMHLAQAVEELGLKHVVVTSVTRDDLADGGAGHFAEVIRRLRALPSGPTVEVLTPDFFGRHADIDTVLAAGPHVFNHNVETTRRLTPAIRSGADYDRSLAVLRYAADQQAGCLVKSGFMLGLGEAWDDIATLLSDLYQAGVAMLTIGQYLQPSSEHEPVQRFYHPNEFAELEAQARALGFADVAAGPFVRSSYHAELGLQRARSSE